MKSLFPRRRGLTRGRGLMLLALVVALAGCGAEVDADDHVSAVQPESCPETVVSTLASVLGRVYREGIASERTRSAEHMIERCMGRPIRVLAPLSMFHKQEVVELARSKGISGTYSCHLGGATPCMDCISCNEFKFKED